MIPAGTVYMVACPVHHRLVGTEVNGHLVGHCSDCVTEAAAAQRMIERGDLAIQLLLNVQETS